VATKLAEYADTGATWGAANMPQLQLARSHAGLRFTHIHHNARGMLARIFDVFASRGLYILTQHFQTDGELGYFVVDVAGADERVEDVLAEMSEIEGTIRARLVVDQRRKQAGNCSVLQSAAG
jgi:D-3-phosphoglycerate dehydrogenase